MASVLFLLSQTAPGVLANQAEWKFQPSWEIPGLPKAASTAQFIPACPSFILLTAEHWQCCVFPQHRQLNTSWGNFTFITADGVRSMMSGRKEACPPSSAATACTGLASHPAGLCQGTEHLWAGDHPSASPQGQHLCSDSLDMGNQRSPLTIFMHTSAIYPSVHKSQQHGMVLPLWLGNSQFQKAWISHLDWTLWAISCAWVATAGIASMVCLLSFPSSACSI